MGGLAGSGAAEGVTEWGTAGALLGRSGRGPGGQNPVTCRESGVIWNLGQGRRFCVGQDGSGFSGSVLARLS